MGGTRARSFVAVMLSAAMRIDAYQPFFLVRAFFCFRMQALSNRARHGDDMAANQYSACKYYGTPHILCIKTHLFAASKPSVMQQIMSKPQVGSRTFGSTSSRLI